MADVLVCGVYLADRENLAAAEIEELSQSREHRVVQRWIALDCRGGGTCDLPCTVAVVRQQTPKFTLISQRLHDVEQFDKVIVCDDDVTFPPGFVDRYLALTDRFGFSLSQPARTPDSFVDHFITTQAPGLRARRTRFVEIGPVTCIDRSAYRSLLPFDPRSPMGWGLDFVWPAIVERDGLRMGIVDATPVGHNLRKSMVNYLDVPVREQMADLLRNNPSLEMSEAFTVLEAYA
jgi:hypothetical protein